MIIVKRALQIVGLIVISLVLIVPSILGKEVNDRPLDSSVVYSHVDGNRAIPPDYDGHRPIIEFFSGLGCSVCQNGADQAMDILFHESVSEPSVPYTIVTFHQNNGAGDDDLTIPESEERYDDYFVQGTPDAEFDGGFRHILGGEDGEEANHQAYTQALSECFTRYEDNTLNPFDNNFKFVNLQVFQEFTGNGYKVSVMVEYLGSASDRPSLGILPINSPDLHGSLYVFMTEDNVTAWSSERNDGEMVINNGVFRGFAIKDEQFELRREEIFEIKTEWEFPEDAVIPVKSGDITAVAAVYDLDDTSSGRSEGGNPANVPRAIQSATPTSTAYDLGNDLPVVEDISISYDRSAHFSVKFDDDDGISKAYVIYNTEASNATNWSYEEMTITGEEICDENDVCYAYANGEGTASIPMKSGDTLYYMILIYDGNSTQGKTGVYTYKASGSEAVAGGNGLSLAIMAIVFGIILLIVGFVYLVRERRKEEVVDVEPLQEDTSYEEGQSLLQPKSLSKKKSSKSIIMGAIIIGILLISVGAVASVLSSAYENVPDIEMRDVNGNRFSLSDHEGKVVLLEFMATWCSTCKTMTENMKDIYSKYKDDIVMISLDIDTKESVSTLSNYANQNGAKWIFAFPEDIAEVLTTFNIHEIPKSLIIDKDGHITYEGIGAISTGKMKEEIDAAQSGMASPIVSYSVPLILLAFAAGIASFFSPCSFPMLPGYIGYYVGRDTKTGFRPLNENIKRALPIGLAAALGILIVYLFIGTLIMIIGSPILPFIPFLAPLIAIIIIVFGILMLTNTQFYFITNSFKNIAEGVASKIKIKDKTLMDRINETETGGIFIYGMGYGLAAAGCTLPIFMGIIAGALLSGGFLNGLAVFFVYGLGAALFMVAVTLLIAASKDSIIHKLKMSTEKIKMVSGLFMIIAGIAVMIGFFIAFVI